jgi:hypothetical protein
MEPIPNRTSDPATPFNRRAEPLQSQAREILPIRGSSDAPGGRRRLALLHAFAADLTVQTFADPSRGGICILCGVAIKPNEIEYGIATTRSAITVEVNCYKAFQQEMAGVRLSRVADAG